MHLILVIIIFLPKQFLNSRDTKIRVFLKTTPTPTLMSHKLTFKRKREIFIELMRWKALSAHSSKNTGSKLQNKFLHRRKEDF